MFDDICDLLVKVILLFLLFYILWNVEIAYKDYMVNRYADKAIIVIR